MLRRVIYSSAVALTLGVAGVALPSVAQEAVMFGEGEDRRCNPVLSSARTAVQESSAKTSVLIHAGTYDCPEEIVAVAPAAPPPVMPLPESGLIYFDFDRAELNAEGQATLDAVIADIKDRELGGVTVGGHTDTAGPAEYNMQLSQQRANTVATELIKSGVSASLIAATAYGQTDLAVETSDGVANQANRRVTVDFSH
jgi:outer membrane protein OmpA-like peptidoglycan-associated protein